MATKYPYKIDDNITLPDVIDNITSVDAISVNRLKEAILAIENELGVKPSGSSGTIKNRLVLLENLIANSNVNFSGDLSGNNSNQTVVGIKNILISNTPPTTNQYLKYNGSQLIFDNIITSSFVPGGDLSGTETYQNVIGIRNIPISPITPTINQILSYNGTSWIPSALPISAPTNSQYITLTADGILTNNRILTAGNNIAIVDSGAGNAITINNTYSPPDASTIAKGIIQLTNDLGGSAALPTVLKVNGTSYTAGGALVTGNSAYVSGVSTTTYSALNLAGGSGWVTGILPVVNQASQTMAGDVTGTTASSTVVKINGTSVPATPTSGQVLTATSGTAATWQTPITYTPIDATTLVKGVIQLAGDIGGTATSISVNKINAASVPSAGALVTGNGLYVSGSSSLSYGPLNLAGGVNYVSGILPTSNQASQSLAGDLSGTTATATVTKVNGATYPAAGALVTGTIPRVTGVSAVNYGALDLSNANSVTGVLATTNLPDAQTLSKGIIRLQGDLGAGSADSPIVKGLFGYPIDTVPFYDGLGNEIDKALMFYDDGNPVPGSRIIKYEWVKVVKPSRTISTGSGLIGGGDLTNNRTLTIDTSVVATLSSGLLNPSQARGQSLFGTSRIQSTTTTGTTNANGAAPFTILLLTLNSLQVGDQIDVNGFANIGPTTGNAALVLTISSSATSGSGTIYSTIATNAFGDVTTSLSELWSVSTAGNHYVHLQAYKFVNNAINLPIYQRRLTAKVFRL